MSRTFGERINEFVLSIDIMDKETFTDLLKLIEVYLNGHLGVTYFSVLDKTVVNDQQGLQTLWSTKDERPSYTIGEKCGYVSHSAITFEENKPIWVVSNSKGQLHGAENLKDLWSNIENLPPYMSRHQEQVCTSVMHPLRKEGDAIGVIEFAVDQYIEPTPASKAEAQTLAAVISRAYQMYDTRRAQRENTKRAINMLKSALETENWARLALPQLFFAYPGIENLEEKYLTEHKKVVETIKAVIDEFKHILYPKYWEDSTEAGNITEQVIRDIRTSEFGLCYFSKRNKEGDFEDNANVLFEAGMMQAWTNSPNALLRGWIPVRQKSSDIPFDISSERIVLVEIENGKFDEDDLKEKLRKYLAALVGILSPGVNG